MNEDKKGKGGKGADGEIEVEVELEKDPPEPDADEPEPEESDLTDICVKSDDRSIDCESCDRIDSCSIRKELIQKEALTSEPADINHPSQVLIDSGTFDDAGVREKQILTEKIYRDRVDYFKAGMLKTVEINPTRDLTRCAAAYLYIRLSSIRAHLSAAEVIQMVSEALTAYKELTQDGVVSREITPPGARIN